MLSGFFPQCQNFATYFWTEMLGINGSGLSVLQNNKLDLVTLNRTGLNDTGLLQAASIPKLTHIQIDDTAVTYEGLLAVC